MKRRRGATAANFDDRARSGAPGNEEIKALASA